MSEEGVYVYDENSASWVRITNEIVVYGAGTEESATPDLVQYTEIYSYTGFQTTFSVPSGVEEITIHCYGAQGGGAQDAIGAYGGYVGGTLPVIPGETVYITVGGQGSGSDVVGLLDGGFNGGGSAYGGNISGAYAASGGGASDVRLGGPGLAGRKIVAGGGGGAGQHDLITTQGGEGGGLQGGDGTSASGSYNGGGGGTQLAGGTADSNSYANPGSWGEGGDSTGDAGGWNACGGGGGYYGGGSGGALGAGGGGGSGFADATATNVTMQSGFRPGNGLVEITYLAPEQSATPESATPEPDYYDGLPVPSEGDLYTSYSPLELWDYTGGIWVPRDTSLNIPLTNLDYMFNAQTLVHTVGSTVNTWPNEGDADGDATGTGIMRAADLNGKPGVDFFQTAHSMVLPGTGTIPQPWSMFILFKEKNSIQTGARVYRGSGDNTLWSSVVTTWQFYVGDSGLSGPTDRSANRTYAMVVTANGGILNFYWASAASGGTTYITSSVGAGGFGTDAFDLDTGFFNHNTSPSDGSFSLGLVGAWGLYSREVSGGEADIILAELMTKWDFTAA